MQLKTSMIIAGKQENSKILNIAKSPESKDVTLAKRTDIKADIKRLLIKHSLSLEDIIIKYKEIYDGKIPGTKVSDIVNVLGNLEKLHGLHTKDESIDELTLTLSAKSPEELEQYLKSTLQKTQEVIAKLQARRINTKST